VTAQTARRTFALALVTAAAAAAQPAREGSERAARSHPTAVDDTTAVGRRAAPMLPMLAGAVVGAATGAQIGGSPEVWGRTWGGYGRRLADQAGFLAVEETVRRSTIALTGWRTAEEPCGTAPGTSPMRPRADIGLGTALRCGVDRTFTARARDGARRPNLPVIGGLVAGTAASLTWRPEGRAGGGDAVGFVATRLAISFGATIVARATSEVLRSRRVR
jgi:hypothetical protein